MNCREAEQHLFADRDGALAEAQRAGLVEHVAQCASCRRMRDNLQAAVTLWRSEVATVRAPSADLEWQKLRRRMSDAPAERRRPLAAWIAVPLGAAAAVAVGLYVTTGSRPDAGPRAPKPMTPAIAATTPNATSASTVVYVDDKSGWTFVWAPDNGGNGQHI